MARSGIGADKWHLPRHCELWLPAYVRGRWNSWFAKSNPKHVWLAIADHFEPLWHNASVSLATERVSIWRRRLPLIASEHADSTGRLPIYTFFYPDHHYRPELLDVLAEMVSLGCADVEVHLHHDREGQQDFTDRIGTFTETLFRRHGLLRKENGSLRFGFIHGNWALCNSVPGGQWCGLNNEITLLRDLGCYADFTMPSGASTTQARTVNSIYWAAGDASRPKSYDQGCVLQPRSASGDLLMIPGPLGLRWKERLWPRMETGEIAGYDMPTLYRANRWLDVAPRLGEHIFIKLFAHGAQERNLIPLLGRGLTELFRWMSTACRDRGLVLHYVSTWQMYRAVMAIWHEIDPLSAAKSS